MIALIEIPQVCSGRTGEIHMSGITTDVAADRARLGELLAHLRPTLRLAQLSRRKCTQKLRSERLDCPG